jgi:phytoene dehydrogenase-like protein
VKAVVVGAGMGGLAAALRLRQAGWEVEILEARGEAGGLAGDFELDGLPFDAGPYVLLDRNGLEWSYRELGLELADQLDLRPLPQLYEVTSPEAPAVRFVASLEETLAGLEESWPGSAAAYRRFVARTERVYSRLEPLQRSRPSLRRLLAAGAWREAPFLLRPLGSVLARTGLPRPVQEAIGIWTHVAGQTLAEAPSPLAFVPQLVHRFGAWLPAGGIAEVPRSLARAAAHRGVEIRYGVRVRAIHRRGDRVTGVETADGRFVPADAVIAGAGALAVYLELLPDLPRRFTRRLRELPLQSPGVCAYLAVRQQAAPPYLRFHLPGRGEGVRLLVSPSSVTGEARDGWWPARLIAPMDHSAAEQCGAEAQQAFLAKVLAEPWWREHTGEFRVLATRIPAEWGREFSLHRDSMNPVMTARFMRAGRIAHRSPVVRGLYLAGSATHPGQWVSFCAISGILAADLARRDLS